MTELFWHILLWLYLQANNFATIRGLNRLLDFYDLYSSATVVLIPFRHTSSEQYLCPAGGLHLKQCCAGILENEGRQTERAKYSALCIAYAAKEALYRYNTTLRSQSMDNLQVDDVILQIDVPKHQISCTSGVATTPSPSPSSSGSKKRNRSSCEVASASKPASTSSGITCFRDLASWFAKHTPHEDVLAVGKRGGTTFIIASMEEKTNSKDGLRSPKKLQDMFFELEKIKKEQEQVDEQRNKVGEQETVLQQQMELNKKQNAVLNAADTMYRTFDEEDKEDLKKRMENKEVTTVCQLVSQMLRHKTTHGVLFSNSLFLFVRLRSRTSRTGQATLQDQERPDEPERASAFKDTGRPEFVLEWHCACQSETQPSVLALFSAFFYDALESHGNVAWSAFFRWLMRSNNVLSPRCCNPSPAVNQRFVASGACMLVPMWLHVMHVAGDQNLLHCFDRT